VIQPLTLEVRQIELIGHQAVGHMPRQPRMSHDGRELARPAALIGDPVALPDTQREVRVVVEEKRGDVVVENEEQHIRPLLRQPALHRLVAGEDRCPHRILLFVGVECEADCRSVGRSNSANYGRHRSLTLRAMKAARIRATQIRMPA